MPTLNFDQLFTLADRILKAAGASTNEALVVASELADANLVGHDSHGVMRLVQYVQMIQDGHVKPGGKFDIVRESPCTLVVDGNFNFGQVIARQALEKSLRKAREFGTATCLIRNCNHVGRLGAYTEAAAKEGFAALMAVNAPGPGGVAPFGGIDRRLGTNPICMAAPSGEGAIVLDMTTSATAEGKLRVSYQKGEMIPEGLIIDGHGNPSTNPADYYNKPYGSILPLGGALMGHKGFGLSVMLDIFCGILSGSGIGREDLPRGANGVWLYLLKVDHFLPRAEYDEWIERYVAHIKSSRLQVGVTEILLPGEIEQRRYQQRIKDGIVIPDETWRQITQTAAALHVSID